MQLAVIERKALAAAKIIFAKQVPFWIKELKKKEIPGFTGKKSQRKTSDKVKKRVTLSKINDSYRILLEKTLMLTYLQGHDSVQKEVEEQKQNKKTFSAFMRPSDWDKLGFDEALAAFKQKKIISPDAYKAASAEIKRISFSIQKIESQNALNAINKSIQLAIDNGMIQSEWQALTPNIFKAHGVTPLSPHHLETVFYNNIGSVYNTARWEAMEQDDSVVAMIFTGVLDDVTTHICRPYIGMIFAKDDPIWGSIMPLNHHLCRSGTSPVSEIRFKRDKLEYSKPPTKEDLARIPKDFRSSPTNLKEYNNKLDAILSDKKTLADESTEDIHLPLPIRYSNCNCGPEIEFQEYTNGVPVKPPFQEKSVTVDICVLPAILELWNAGITTMGNCCGHNRLLPTVVVDEKDVQRMKYMGYRWDEEWRETMGIHVFFIKATRWPWLKGVFCGDTPDEFLNEWHLTERERRKKRMA